MLALGLAARSLALRQAAAPRLRRFVARASPDADGAMSLEAARARLQGVDKNAAMEDDGSTRPWATYEVVHEDSEILVINKGAGLLSVPGRGDHKLDSLLTRLRASYGEGVGAAHRLDRDTSGLCVYTRTKAALRTLSMAFEAREVEKAYVGACAGSPGAESGAVDAPIGKVFDEAAGFNRAALVEGGRPSRTEWRVLERETESALLSLVPVTGRPQQLRLHLASIGHPLFGDALHGTPAALGASPDRLCLHAARLSFAHPATGAATTFESAAPFDAAGAARP